MEQLTKVTVAEAQPQTIDVSYPAPPHLAVSSTPGPAGPAGDPGPMGPAGMPADWDSSAQGFIAYTYDPIYAGSNRTMTTDGGVELVRVRVREASTVSTIEYLVAAAVAYVATVGQNMFMLYTADRELIASTGDISATMNDVGAKWHPLLGGPYTLAPGFYYIGTMLNGTGTLQLCTVAGTSGGRSNVGLRADAYRAARSTVSGTTVPPASIADSTLTITTPWWAALSREDLGAHV